MEFLIENGLENGHRLEFPLSNSFRTINQDFMKKGIPLLCSYFILGLLVSTLNAQAPTNRFGTQDFIVIDSVNVDSSGTSVNLVPGINAYILAHATDSISFAGGAMFLVSDSIEAWALDDSLVSLHNTQINVGYLRGPAGGGSLAVLTTSDVKVLAETVGISDVLNLGLGRFRPSYVQSGDVGRISYIFAQLLPDSIHPCDESELSALALAQYRAAQGLYQVVGYDSAHIGRCYHRCHWDCDYGIIWYPKWGIEWGDSGWVASDSIGVVPITSVPVTLTGAISIVAVTPISTFGSALYWNHWLDASPDVVFYHWPYWRNPLYSTSCKPYDDGLPRSQYNTKTPTCHCFEIKCVDQCLSYPINVTDNGWSFVGGISLMDKTCSGNNNDALQVFMTINHDEPQMTLETNNPGVYEFSKLYTSSGFGQTGTFSEIDIHPGWKKHAPFHFDDVYLQTVKTVVGPTSSDIDSWKICFNVRHRFRPIACTGGNITLEATHVGIPSTLTWVGPNGFISSLAEPELQNITSAMAGDYVATVTPQGGCSFMDTVRILVVDSARATIISPPDTTITTGDSITLIGSTSVFPISPAAVAPVGAWHGNGSSLIGDSVTVAPTVTTTYYFKIINLTGACADSDSVTITVLPVAIEREKDETGSISDLRINPIPTSDRLRITGMNQDVPIYFTILDPQGRPIMQGNTRSVDTQALPQGLYFIRISAMNDMRTMRFVKQ